MKYRNRRVVGGAAVLAPLLALVLWFAAAPANRCTQYQNLGFVYLAKGTLASQTHLGAAQRWFSDSLAAACPPASAAFGLGQTYAGLGQPALALAALQDGPARPALRHFVAGRLYETLGRPAEAWVEFSQLPRDAAAHFFRLGAAAEGRDDFDLALHYFSVARLINPAAPKAYYRAAFVYWRRLDDPGKAVALIRQALAVDRKPSVERDFYQGLLCYYERNTGCALAAWVSAVRETARVDHDTNPQYLAYEMLSRTLAEHARSAGGRPVVLSPRGFGAVP